MSEDLRIRQDGRLLRVILGRPDCGVSDSMAARLAELLARAHESADAVLLTSAGADFCTGRVRDIPGPPAAEAYARRPEYDGVFNSYRAIRQAELPVIAALNGRVMGYGTAVAALCDVSFAADSATFSIPEIAHNVMPTMVMSAVQDRMSRNAILWMAYSAEPVPAERALAYGIVSQVVPEARLAEEAERFCQLLLSRPRPAILGLKEYLRVAPRMDEQGAHDYARSLHALVNTAAAMKRQPH